MEALKIVKTTLLKSFVYGFILLIISHLMYVYNFEFLFNICQKVYQIDKATFINDMFLLYSLFKVLIVVFFLLPGLALWCSLKNGKCCCKTEDKE